MRSRALPGNEGEDLPTNLNGRGRGGPGAMGGLQLGFSLRLNYWQSAEGLPPGDPSAQAMWRRHNGRWQLGFCDGHSENLRGVDLLNLSNPAVQRRWNMDNQAHAVDWIGNIGPKP